MLYGYNNCGIKVYKMYLELVRMYRYSYVIYVRTVYLSKQARGMVDNYLINGCFLMTCQIGCCRLLDVHIYFFLVHRIINSIREHDLSVPAAKPIF